MVYSGFKAKEICGSQLSARPNLFTLCIEWLMKETTKSEIGGIDFNGG